MFSFPAITEEHLEWFVTGCLSFNMYGKQNDKIIESRQKMTTKVFPYSFGLKACDRYFLSNLYFSLNDSPSKTMKNVFYFI